MITLDQYKELLAITTFQYEQARDLICDLTDKGILLSSGCDVLEPERLFFDSKENYQSRKTMYDMIRFRSCSQAYDIEYQVAALLSELGVTVENRQEVYTLVTQIMIETKPFLVQHYLRQGFKESTFWASDFNIVLLWFVRTSVNGWAIPTAIYPVFPIMPESSEVSTIPSSEVKSLTSKPVPTEWTEILQLQASYRELRSAQYNLDYQSMPLDDSDETLDVKDLECLSIEKPYSGPFYDMFNEHFPSVKRVANQGTLNNSVTENQA